MTNPRCSQTIRILGRGKNEFTQVQKAPGEQRKDPYLTGKIILRKCGTSDMVDNSRPSVP